MIIDHADGLHERVTDGGPDEAKPALHERLAHRVRFAGARRQLADRAPPVLLRRPSHEAPEKRPEPAGTIGGHEVEERARIRYRRRDLLAVTHDAGVLQEL